MTIRTNLVRRGGYRQRPIPHCGWIIHLPNDSHKARYNIRHEHPSPPQPKPNNETWNGVKHLLRYLKGTSDLGLYYQKSNSPEIQGFADSGFRTDPNAGKSQTGYVFLKCGAPISWKPPKDCDCYIYQPCGADCIS